MRKIIFGSFLILINFISGKAEKVNDVVVSESSNIVVIENKYVKVKYDLNRGVYSAFDKIRDVEALYMATSQINDFNSSDIGVENTYKILNVNEKLGTGKAIVVMSNKLDSPEQLLVIKLFNDKPFVVFQSGIKNKLNDSYVLKRFYPVVNASIFNGVDLKENFRLLDGEGGGVETFIRRDPFLLTQNNLIFNCGNNDKRYTLVAGGLTYNEFEKFAFVTDGRDRKMELATLARKSQIMEYVDAGNSNYWAKMKYLSIDKADKIYSITNIDCTPEAKTFIYDKNELKIGLQNLDPNKTYTLGFVWGAYDSQIIQSVHLLANNNSLELIAPMKLSNLQEGEDPQLFLAEITPEMMKDGFPTIVIRKNEGSNCLLNELVLFEGGVPDDLLKIPLSAKRTTPNRFDRVKFNLYSEDPIGKLVEPGEIYLPDKDAFYIDFNTINPLESAENYASAVKTAQSVKLNYYYFPTIDLWYAMQPSYGGSTSGQRAINDTPGAVDEMKRVKDSGWLKYTKMGIRLVPDCYDENNENGWWDDKHWQMYGSGVERSQSKIGMGLPKGHYREPYETSKKWAKAILDLGGLPLFYIQTGLRSKDYCEKFPSHMLHNQSFYVVENQFDRSNKNFGTYDFTDKEFVTHLKKSYSNLRRAGIMGMMFDYPYTAWAHYGGMDDRFSTTAGMYRRVFELASNGMGNYSYVQERNLSRGSDINVGLVESQRIWSDNDIINPEMIMRGGLRWYKNRVLFNFDMDAKSLTKAKPSDTPDGLNKLLTMSYVSGSRLLLGQSFLLLDSNVIQRLSRIFPFHQNPQSSRPIDAFSSDYPRVYDFRVDDKWHQLTFFNEDNENPKTISVDLSGISGFGGIGLDRNNAYYIYDFWNDQFVGEFKGDVVLKQELRKGEARMMSVHKRENYPQVLSTDRHLMQGYIELSDIKWKDNKLSGKANVVEKEPMKIVIANNGMQPLKVKTSEGSSSFKLLPNGLMEVTIKYAQKAEIEWSVLFY